MVIPRLGFYLTVRVNGYTVGVKGCSYARAARSPSKWWLKV